MFQQLSHLCSSGLLWTVTSSSLQCRTLVKSAMFCYWSFILSQRSGHFWDQSHLCYFVLPTNPVPSDHKIGTKPRSVFYACRSHTHGAYSQKMKGGSSSHQGCSNTGLCHNEIEETNSWVLSICFGWAPFFTTLHSLLFCLVQTMHFHHSFWLFDLSFHPLGQEKAGKEGRMKEGDILTAPFSR